MGTRGNHIPACTHPLLSLRMRSTNSPTSSMECTDCRSPGAHGYSHSTSTSNPSEVLRKERGIFLSFPGPLMLKRMGKFGAAAAASAGADVAISLSWSIPSSTSSVHPNSSLPFVAVLRSLPPCHLVRALTLMRLLVELRVEEDRL